MMAALPVRPGEDPFVVAMGGFYRRWFNLVDDLRPLLDTVPTLERNFLHAASIRFLHPRTGLPLEVRAPLPAELKQFLTKLAPLPG